MTKVLGIPVRQDANPLYFWGARKPICDSQGIWPFKRIVVRPDFHRFPPREQQAILMHEAAHCLAFHSEKRLLRLVLWPFGIAAYCREQEFIADRFVKECGFGADLARAFSRLSGDAGPFHPSTAERIERLTTTS